MSTCALPWHFSDADNIAPWPCPINYPCSVASSGFVLGSGVCSRTHLLRALLGSLAGLDATGLAGRSVLLGLLGAANGAHTGDGLLANVGTVAVLGSLVGNTLVDPGGLELESLITRQRNHLGAICLLASGALGAVVDSNGVLTGLLGVAGLLGDHVNTTVLGSLDTNGLEEQALETAGGRAGKLPA